ncbi:MAG: NADP-reducing hydrogenase subunit HndC [Candidatus Sumerlaeota bacterium]|nr:NADP-reducing hydrogenase subunit HndC [Candidatus Sumerlaeota bacterium]
MAKLTFEELDKLRDEYRAQRAQRSWIRVGTSTCGIAAGAEAVYRTIVDEVRRRDLDIDVQRVGCVGMCYAEPLVEVNVQGAPRTMYSEVGTEAAERIVAEHVVNGNPIPGLAIPGIETLGYEDDGLAARQGKQVRIVLRNCGLIDPTKIEDSIARGGYQGLKRALFDLREEGVLEEMKASGLRGRGGAGYPTWLKWKSLREAHGPEKYMICNADEGDPGAYMDRSVLEGDPHTVIEGMLIACFATGTSRGYLYIRAEYPLAIDRIETALRQARRMGLIGKNILGTEFSCDLEVRLGAGAFVCGEETALMHSIEGKRGTPRPRPPFPAQSGLWGNPTNINNVETFANVAPIIVRGGEWFAQWGSGKSFGTKVFAVTGKVRHSGLVEIPMGTTLREIVVDICGGVPAGHRIKAVQTGGPSGGVIPSELLDTPVSYEGLQELGSIMGSGGMIVMDESDSMIDIVKFYTDFCVEESCGKCAPCRIGGKQMCLLLEKIQSGKGTWADVDTMKRVCLAMQKASLCGLGQTAPNPVLSTLRYFEDEYRALLGAR